jgi:hypothetical protein
MEGKYEGVAFPLKANVYTNLAKKTRKKLSKDRLTHFAEEKY